LAAQALHALTQKTALAGAVGHHLHKGAGAYVSPMLSLQNSNRHTD
jgi:hypothetical protein